MSPTGVPELHSPVLEAWVPLKHFTKTVGDSNTCLSKVVCRCGVWFEWNSHENQGCQGILTSSHFSERGIRLGIARRSNKSRNIYGKQISWVIQRGCAFVERLLGTYQRQTTNDFPLVPHTGMGAP